MIELHRHVGGSINTTTIQMMKKDLSLSEIQQALIMNGDDEKTFHKFLSKFDILDKVEWTRENIELAVRQVCWDVVKEQIQYCELKFSIGRYVKDTEMTPEEVIIYISDILIDESHKWDVQIVPVFSLKYETPREIQSKFAQVINNSKVAERIVGLDLVGDEQFFDHRFYKPIFDYWRSFGKGLQAHVGESQDVQNIRLAIEELGVNRIAHGIKAIEDDNIIKLLIDRNVSLDIAITSNICTGVVKSLSEHPVRKLFDMGVPITIGTDDPVILNTTIRKEFELLEKAFNFTADEISLIINNSAKFAFAFL